MISYTHLLSWSWKDVLTDVGRALRMHWVRAAEEYFAGSSCGFEWNKDFFLQINARLSFPLAACLDP